MSDFELGYTKGRKEAAEEIYTAATISYARDDIYDGTEAAKKCLEIIKEVYSSEIQVRKIL